MTTAQNKSPPQHSAGPWRVSKRRVDGMATIDSFEWTGLAHVHVRMLGEKKDCADGKANLRLIAAAPDLLDALQNFMNGIETRMVRVESDADETLANAFAKIRKALAKAKGAA